jgi:hypothetical protein
METKPTTKKGISPQEKSEVIDDYSMEAYAGFDPNDHMIIDPAIKKEITDRGLKYKWINANKLASNNGFNKKGWKPYKLNSQGKSVVYGQTDAEGYLRRGDLVLAVMPLQLHARHKAAIDQANLLNKAATGSKEAAKEIKNKFRDNKVKGVRVLEGEEE